MLAFVAQFECSEKRSWAMLGNLSRITLAFLFVILVPSWAQASQWVASKVAQPARYTVDNKNWVTIKRGMAVPKRSWIKTGKRGRLILRRGKEMIMYRPSTLAYLRSSQTNGRKTYIQQQFGSLLLDVETRKRKHVTVKTPLLAAVVKGTRFEVKVSKRKASVSVKRGVVGVISNSSGQAVDIRSGQQAAVSSASSGKVAVSGATSSVFSKLFKEKTADLPDTANANAQANANNSNSNRGGNANGNSNGNANGTGNGNGNSNGNGNGNANGNGNGNSNGNGNGNGNGK
ncbi:MAG: FecR family protein [Rhizobiaceae bacterium]